MARACDREAEQARGIAAAACVLGAEWLEGVAKLYERLAVGTSSSELEIQAEVVRLKIPPDLRDPRWRRAITPRRLPGKPLSALLTEVR